MAEMKNIALQSAAGSGKTRELTKRFLLLFLDDARYPLKTIYGITFTNEATREMKKRILAYLDLLARGTGDKDSDREILAEFEERFPDVRERARRGKRRLLHNLSDLHISTFHSLFASFLSSIPFAAGIVPGYEIIDELAEDRLFAEVMNQYFAEVRGDRKVLDALHELAQAEEKSLKTAVRDNYRWLRPYFPYLTGLAGREERIRADVQKARAELIETLEEFRRFVHEHEAAARIGTGKMDRNFAGFLAKFEDFFQSGKVEQLPEKFLAGSYLGLNYLHKFMTNLGAEDGPFIRIIGAANSRLHKLLSNLSDEQILVHLKPIADLHRRWTREKRERNVLTFDDIETLTLSALRNDPDVDYLYFKIGADVNHLLIDEFQDTSLVQLNILDPIIAEITSQEPRQKSLFYVGDPRQAIFRWRGGAAELFDLLLERYPGKIKKERLTWNHRSERAIVDFVNRVIGSNDQAEPAREAGWIRVENIGVFGRVEEARDALHDRLCRIVQDLHQNQGYDYGEIAVLTRRNRPAAEAAEALGRVGIPCLSRSAADLLTHPDACFVLNLLRFLDDPEDDFSLAHVLLSSVFRVREADLAGLRCCEPKKTLYLALSDRHPDWPSTRALASLLKMVHFLDPYELLYRIYKELRLPISYPLATLLDAASGYVRDGFQPLNAFVEWLADAAGAIEIQEARLEGISVLNVHKAKGLEFEIVILAETYYEPRGGENPNLIFSYKPGGVEPDRIYWRKYGSYDPKLVEAEAERIRKDEANLLYVALTRARRGLHVLGYSRDKDPQDPQGFWFRQISDAAGKDFTLGEIPVKGAPRHADDAKPYGAFSEKPLPVREERDLYSPTEREVEIIEPERKRGMEFGEIAHKALSRVEGLDGQELAVVIREAVKYAVDLYARRSEEVDRIAGRLRPLLEKVLVDPDLHFLFYRDAGEREFRNELAVYYEEGRKDVSVHIDRLIIEPGKITIVDYKTGAGKDEYREQLQVYKKGIELVYPGRRVETLIVYLENEPGERIVKLSL
jgi:ATP-dependent exoDNAse (exonuclease V) beta subunit